MSPEPSSASKKLTSLIIQGLIGAIALAGTTAIPLIVRQMLEPSGTAPETPAAVSSPEPSATTVAEPQPDAPGMAKGKDKPKKVKD
jgi:hypothetical protein